MTLWDRVVAWWNAPGEVTFEPRGCSTVTISVTGGDSGDWYRVTLGEDNFAIRRRPWDTNRSIARRLRRQLERSGWIEREQRRALRRLLERFEKRGTL